MRSTPSATSWLAIIRSWLVARYGSPSPTRATSPLITPSTGAPFASSSVRKRASGPHLTSAVEVTSSFSFDAGDRVRSPLREYSVRPVARSRTYAPELALRWRDCAVSFLRSVARSSAWAPTALQKKVKRVQRPAAAVLRDIGPRLHSASDGQGRPPRAGQAAAAGKGGWSPVPCAPPPALQDCSRPRGRWLHGRRLRDRRPARARPPLGQPDRQPVRRLRRDLGRLVRGLAGRQRGHARGDDAGRQPAGADPVPRH